MAAQTCRTDMLISIPGIPQQNARMRSYIRGGRIGLFDPQGAEKKKIRAYLEQISPEEKFEHPRISFIFLMPIPASRSATKKQSLAKGLTKHEKKPDVDNLIKLYLDCMDGIFFDHDQKVMLGRCVKLYHPYPKTLIHLAERQEIIQPWEVEPDFLGAKEYVSLSSFEKYFLLDYESPEPLAG